MTRVSLLQKEYDLLHAHALANNCSDVLIIRQLIFDMPKDIYTLERSEDKLISKGFDLQDKALEILKEKSEELEISINKLIRYLIASLKPIEKKEQEYLDKEIATFISLSQKNKLETIAKKSNMKIGELFRKDYQKIINSNFKIIQKEAIHTKRILVNVTESFKNEFKVTAKQHKVKESTLLRSLLLKIQK